MRSLVNIKVIGVGGAGNNAINRMIQENVNGVDYIAVNTDEQVLALSLADATLVLGQQLTKGMGAGADPEIGQQAAIEQEADIRALLKDADLVFIATGLGGGTGTGAAPIIAKVAKEEGILTIAAVTKPFTIEGPQRSKNAEEGLAKLREYTDTIITIPNDKLFEIIDKATPLVQAFEQADKLLKHSITSIADLVLFPGLINLDFADITRIIKNSGTALFGIGAARGDEAALDAAKQAIGHPLLEIGLEGASKAIINITGGEDMSLHAVSEAITEIRNSTSKDLDIIFGTNIVEEMQDQIILTIIATGYDQNQPIQKLNSHGANFGIDERSEVFEKFKQKSEIPVINHGEKDNGATTNKVTETQDGIGNTRDFSQPNVNVDMAAEIFEDTLENISEEEELGFNIPNFFNKK